MQAVSSIVGKIWGLDGKPYLIIYPHRKVHTRKFPVVAHEDVMAFHIIESFLNEYEVNVELSTFPVPDIKERDGEWFPGEIQKKVEDFEGHVIYLCSLSISPDLKKFLLEKGFPYEIVGIGTESPELRHLKKSQMVFKSPSDMDTPQPRDYSIIAKFERPQGKGIGYIAAGIRAMGTWGAAEYLTDRNNIKTLSQFEKNKQFVAIVETEFDPGKYKVVKSRLHIAPEEF